MLSSDLLTTWTIENTLEELRDHSYIDNEVENYRLRRKFNRPYRKFCL